MEQNGHTNWLETLDLLELVTCTPHDLDNAFKAAVSAVLPTRQQLSSLWGAIESFRNGFADVARHLEPWVSERIVQKADDKCDAEQVYSASFV